MSQEFYFVRHGQTALNLLEGTYKGEHPDDLSINETGRRQAEWIAPTISKLPIRTICCSPLQRALETKEILTKDLEAHHHIIPALGECTAPIWRALTQLDRGCPFPTETSTAAFLAQVKQGIEHVLTLPGPALIVSHGGVHLALSWLLDIQDHSWIIDNCTLVHFVKTENNRWIGKKLS
jgi:probable phosphoglycerate mutase